MTKTWPVSTQVLKLEKDNSIKQTNQKHNYSFTSLGKCSKATYLYGRYMYGRLSVHLKGKLEPGIFINGMITKCERGKSCTYLKKRNSISNIQLSNINLHHTATVCGSVLWMKRRRFLRAVWKTVVNAYQLRQGYKKISKKL